MSTKNDPTKARIGNVKLENRYIVIKRDKLRFVCRLLKYDEEVIEQVCNRIAEFINHDYFVMNLDEPEAVAAMMYYFELKD